jgi:hypothetical protein
LLNGAIQAGEPSLGIRLQLAPGVDAMGGAMTFHQFRLTDAAMPEPSGFLLGASCLVAVIRQELRRSRSGAAATPASKGGS